jgi:hypothetical protein
MQRDIFRDILMKAQEEGNLVAVYADPDDLEHFLVGSVRSIGDSDFTLDRVSPLGEPEGTIGRRFSQVFRISQDSRYLRQIALLIKKHRKEFDKKPVKPTERRARRSFVDELKLAKKHREPVALQIGPYTDVEDVVGYVRKITDTYVQISELSVDGERDGVSTVKLEHVFKLAWGTKGLRAFGLFYRFRKKLYKEEK